jgi:hypothetical protein
MAEPGQEPQSPLRVALSTITILVLLGIGAYMIYYLYQS